MNILIPLKQTEVGKLTFIKVCKSQICKILRCASLQIENPKISWLIHISQIANFLKNSAQLCLKIVLTVFLKPIFYFVEIWIKALYASFVREKVCICWLAEVLSSQITKKNRYANRKSAKWHICGRTSVRKFADCYLLNIFAGRPSLETIFNGLKR